MKGEKGPMGLAFKGPPGVKGQKGAKGEGHNCTDGPYVEQNCTSFAFKVGFHISCPMLINRNLLQDVCNI